MISLTGFRLSRGRIKREEVFALLEMSPRTKSGWDRGLLTQREREIIAGEDDVSDNYRSKMKSRLRKKIKRLERDKEILEENNEDFAARLEEAVCTESSIAELEENSR